MYRDRSHWGFALLALMLLALALVACGGDGSGAAAPPAAPPRFEPQAVEVPLGTSGESLALMTTETGGYTLNGQAFASGTEVVAENNGSTYTLILEGTTWRAVYKAPAPISLALGTTGGSLAIERLEDGAYQANGSSLTSGTVVEADNGNRYIVSISADGEFMAEYVVPPVLTIPLGASGSSVDVIKREDGTYQTNGEAISAEALLTADDGNVYRWEISAEGVPVALTHIGATQDVNLGNLGGTLSLTQVEDKSWVVTGTDTAVSDGYLHMAPNGNAYRLTINADGVWSSMYQAVEATVALGTRGSVTLTRAEDMSWSHGPEAVVGGSELRSADGSTYTLHYADGAWSARFKPVTKIIAGTGLTAITREVDNRYEVGNTILSANGTGDVTVGGAMYHVWMQDDGELAGARFDQPIHGDSDDPTFAVIGDLRASTRGKDILPVLSSDDESTAANELGTTLQLGDHSFSIADLLDRGMATDAGAGIVSEARKEITKVREDLAALLAADSDLGTSTVLDSAWSTSQRQVNAIFGPGTVDLGERPRRNMLVQELDGILAALSTGTEFAAATNRLGGGVFEDAELSEADALEAFDATETEATASFGVTQVTRYGAVTVSERSSAVAGPDYNTGGNVGKGDYGEMGLIGAFSYSTIDDVWHVEDIQITGKANYAGGTRAVSGDGKLYTGDIVIEIDFSGDAGVSGMVTNLRSAEGSAWQLLFLDVEDIYLSPARGLNSRAHWARRDSEQTASHSAQVAFPRRAGSPPPLTVRGSFRGQLLGRGPNSGNYAHGTWSVGEQDDTGRSSYLVGGFGAVRLVGGSPVGTSATNRPPYEAAATSNDWVPADILEDKPTLDASSFSAIQKRADHLDSVTADSLTIPGMSGGEVATSSHAGRGMHGMLGVPPGYLIGIDSGH